MTPRVTVLVPPALADSAREAAGRSGAPDAPLSLLIRAGLAILTQADTGQLQRALLAQCFAPGRPGTPAVHNTQAGAS